MTKTPMNCIGRLGLRELEIGFAVKIDSQGKMGEETGKFLS